MVDVVEKTLGSSHDRVHGRFDMVPHGNLFYSRITQEAWKSLNKKNVIYASGIDDPRDHETPGWSTFGTIPLGGLKLVFA